MTQHYGKRQVSNLQDDDGTAAFLHVDMDAFFASVEVRERPELRGKPVIVGGIGPRSVVSSATYEARRFGVHSAMPVATALRLCPGAIVVESHFALYREASRAIMSIFESFTPLVQPLSIDEAFLDVTGARKLFGLPTEIAMSIRERIAGETELPSSVGGAATMFVAKVASSIAKPNGLKIVNRGETLRFLHPLPIGVLWGVGAVTRSKLERAGLFTVGDVADAPAAMLVKLVGEAGGGKLAALARGLDERGVVGERVEKSVSHEVTFDEDVSDRVRLRRELLRLSGLVSRRLRAGGLTANGVTVKVKYPDFRVITRSTTLNSPTATGRELFSHTLRLLDDAVPDERAIRLIGVRADHLLDADGLPSAVPLWNDLSAWDETERALDRVTEKFGRGLIRPASLLQKKPSPGGESTESVQSKG